MKADVRRRLVLMGGTLAAGVAAIGTPRLLLAQTQPIRIGIVNALTGPNSPFGESNLIGHRIAVSQFNKAGGLAGRQVELVVRDDRAQASQGVAHARDLAGSGINLRMGAGSSAVAIGICSMMPELKSVFVVNSASAMAITHEAWNRHIFRLCPNAYTTFGALGRNVAEAHPNVMKWALITPDYSFGHDSSRVFAAAVRERLTKGSSKGFDISRNIVVGATQSDFRPQINALMNSDIEALFIGLQGANEINFFQQARAVGLDRKLKVLAETGGDVVFLALGKDLPEAIWTAAFWPYSVEPLKSNKASQQLLEDYIAMTGNQLPNGHMYKGYHAMQGFLEGIKKARSTETEAVINAMEDLTWQAPTGTVTVRKQDHAAIGSFFIAQYVRQDTAPFFRVKLARQTSELGLIETPSPGKEYVM